MVVVDQEYTHALESLRTQMVLQQGFPSSEVVFIEAPQRDMEPHLQDRAASPPETDAQAADGTRNARLLCGLWELPEHVKPAECSLVWVGSSSPALLRTLMSLPLHSDGSPIPCAQYEPVTSFWSPSAGQKEDAARLLKRRYYLVERAKDASIVGIIAGTLSVAGARRALDRVRRLAEAAGKKTYTFLVGKPNPAKLGNFPEVRPLLCAVRCDHDSSLLAWALHRWASSSWWPAQRRPSSTAGTSWRPSSPPLRPSLLSRPALSGRRGSIALLLTRARGLLPRAHFLRLRRAISPSSPAGCGEARTETAMLQQQVPPMVSSRLLGRASWWHSREQGRLLR